MQGIHGTPRVPRNSVSRSRLSQALNTDSALIVVHGAAGAGKTVAVADWASNETSVVPGVWLTIDQGSNTRLAFWGALAELLSDAKVAPVAAILSEGLSSLEPADDPRRLVLRAFAQLHGGFRLVLDDFAEVSDELILHDVIALLRASPRLTAIVITRNPGEFDSLATRLSLSPLMLGPAELHLSAEEVSDVLELAQVADPDNMISEALTDTVEGHPLLTRGIIQAIARGDVAFAPDTLRATVTDLGAQLLRELVLSNLSLEQELRSALFCSIPTVLTGGLVDELTGLDNGAELLARFEGEGLGNWSDGASFPTFSFSPLVRSALRAELDVRLPDEVVRLSRISARWSSQNGRPMTALTHAIDAGDLDLASDIVIEHWATLLRPHRQGVIALLDPLPIRRLSRHPVLAMWLALAHNASGLHKTRAFEFFSIATASARLRRDKEPPARRAILYLIESSALRVLGHSHAAVSAADRGRALVEELSVESREALGPLLPTMLNHAGLTYLYSGRPAVAMRMFEAAVSRSGSSREQWALHARCLIAGLHAIQGNMTDAANVAEQIRAADWPESLLNGYWGALLHVAEAHSALERLDFAAARDHLAVMAPHLPTIEHWPLFAHIEAMALLGQGEAHAALASIEAEVATHSRVTTSGGRIRVDTTRALLNLATGNASKAEVLLKEHSKKLVPIAIGRARLELLRGRPEEASSSLLAVEGIEDASVRWLSELHVLRAGAAMRLGRVEAALTAADAAAALMSEHSLRMPLLLLPQRDLVALRSALSERGPSLAWDVFSGTTDYPSLLPDAAPSVSLTEREFVVLRALASTDSVATIAEELFVSKNTVKSQLRSMYRKLGVSSRDEALLVASELHLTR